MSLTLSVPAEYSYVLATLVLSAVVNQYHGALVGAERKKAAVPYPNAYASAAEAKESIAKHRFNCAQRAHSNYLENLPSFLTTSLIAGLNYPVATGALGAVWLVGRVIYARGYINSPPANEGKGRYKGAFYFLAHFGLLGLAGWTVGKMVLQTLEK